MPSIKLGEMVFDHRDLQIMLQTVAAEARGEPWLGKVGVCHVILTRALNPKWWSRHHDDLQDDTLAAVCKDPAQFSCWDDPKSLEFIRTMTLSDAGVRDCAAAITGVLSGLVGDPTKGATHYHNTSVSPKWSRTLTPSLVVGHHLFYNTVP